jgi:hypothetical protein
MSDPTTPTPTYAEQAAAQDGFLDDKLAEIRAQEAAGTISIRAAADARVEALQHHLAAVVALRVEFFGNGEQS